MTTIEWVKNPDGAQGITLNLWTGCLNHTPEGLCLGGLFPCYAFKLAHGRLSTRYLANDNIAKPIKDGCLDIQSLNKAFIDPFYPRLWPDRVVKAEQILRASRKELGIFGIDMGEWAGDWVPISWQRWLFTLISRYPQHRWYLLTKQPQNLPQWSPFPDNCWVGVTATSTEMLMKACSELEYPVQAKVKYISIEPFLEWSFNWNESYLINLLNRAHIKWLIIGACTGRKTEIMELCQRYPELTPMPYGKIWTAQPPISWVQEIVEAADKAGVPVFLKDNLMPLIIDQPRVPTWSSNRVGLRQEINDANS